MRIALPSVALLLAACAGAPSPAGNAAAVPAPVDHAAVAQPAAAPEADSADAVGREIEQERKADPTRFREPPKGPPPKEPSPCVWDGSPRPCLDPLSNGP